MQNPCLTIYSFMLDLGSKCRISHFPNEHLKNLPTPTTTMKTHLSKRGRARRAEDLLGGDLGDTVGEGEGEVLGDQLLEVGALDVLGLLDLDNTEDLHSRQQNRSRRKETGIAIHGST